MSKKKIKGEGNERKTNPDNHSQPTLLELVKALENQDYILIVPIGEGDIEDGQN